MEVEIIHNSISKSVSAQIICILKINLHIAEAKRLPSFSWLKMGSHNKEVPGGTRNQYLTCMYFLNVSF